MTLPKVTIVVPAYNEQEGIGQTLSELVRRFPDAEILVIDDGSTDATAERVAGTQGVRLLRHETNRGYGASIKTGISNAKGDMVAWYDADGQHTADGLERLLTVIDAEKLHAVIGERGDGSSVDPRRRLGKAILSLIVQTIAGERIPDINCGLRVFKRSVIRRYAHLLPDGFSASITSTLLMRERGYRFRFVPVITRGRIGTSSVRRVRDGLRSIQTSLRILVLFQAFQAFSLVAGLLFGIGSVYGVGMALTYGQGFPALASILVLSGVIIFFMGLLTDQVVALRMERLEESIEVQDSRDSSL